MRRGKMLAAAVVSACLTLGSMTTGWAAMEWDEMDMYNAYGYESTVMSATEYFTGQADDQGEILVHLTETSWDGVTKSERDEYVPVLYLNKDDTIYLKNLKVHSLFGWLDVSEFYPSVGIYGTLPEADGSVQCYSRRYMDGTNGIAFETSAFEIVLDGHSEDTTWVAESPYTKVKEAALAQGHQPEDYVYLLYIWSETPTDYSSAPMWLIRFAGESSAEMPVDSVSSAAPAGAWKSDSKGWWIAYPDGSYLVNGWYQSPESGLWYYMGADGYMLENQWLCDPGSGLWYYLGSGGAMLTSAYTPDGYWVGVDGVWAQ